MGEGQIPLPPLIDNPTDAVLVVEASLRKGGRYKISSYFACSIYPIELFFVRLVQRTGLECMGGVVGVLRFLGLLRFHRRYERSKKDQCGHPEYLI